MHALFATLLLAATGLALAAAPSPQALEGLDAKAAVALANDWRFAGEKVRSFITTEALHVVFADGREVLVPLPADEVYVGVAPYLNHTHPCVTHYLSSCTGELQNVTFQVTAKTVSGAVVFEGVVTSLPSGFIELWLPRGHEFMLAVEAQGYQASETISTLDGAPTCITTLQLH